MRISTGMKSRRKKVLVLDGNNRAALAVIEGLHKAGHIVDVASYTLFCKAFFHSGVRRRLTYHFESPEAFKESLLAILIKGEYSVVIPLTDRTSFLLLTYKDDFSKLTTITPLVSIQAFSGAYDKRNTIALCRKYKVPIPITILGSDADADKKLHALRLPVVVKRVSSQGGLGMKMLETHDEVKRFIKTVKHIERFLFQEKCEKKEKTNVALIMDQMHRVIASIVFREPRTYPILSGPSACVETTSDDEALDTAKRLMKMMKWVGIAHLEFHRDENGNLSLMEINPRFWASLRVALAVGINLPDLLVRVATGMEQESNNTYEKGIKLRYLPSEIRWFFSSPDRFKHADFFKFIDRKTKYVLLQARQPWLPLGFLIELFFNWPRYVKNRISGRT
ncbi:ATP-grasp domain-containing protein [Candidatus Woesearchaeota archaeon]|nr:ATP-grasp domain-containing protein [Candidatus Woesearchaeota archaeon]